MCGGTFVLLSVAAPVVGLSPRVRGNPDGCSRRCRPSRSIPACAGEPEKTKQNSKSRRVYPRVCGGTKIRIDIMASKLGLSPRVRGNRRRRPAQHPGPGSIPACAGEPTPTWTAGSAAWVYPRVCGGTAYPSSARPAQPGLSPRVRGNRSGNADAAVFPGSIPACAGEPQGLPPILHNARVYPRVCGGTAALRPGCPVQQGLSPRVRGNQVRRWPAGALTRSIPACAGEPQTRRCL